MSQYNNQAHINEYNSQQPQTTETKANNTVVAYNRPVKIYGDAGALIEYQPMLPYMSNGNVKYHLAFCDSFMKISINKNTGTIRLSGKYITDILPEDHTELVLLPSWPNKNGGQS
tara:strand:+ start:205 stop:549 length:345 start_codon:yes stop_codon:yes gene_type:complete